MSLKKNIHHEVDWDNFPLPFVYFMSTDGFAVIGISLVDEYSDPVWRLSYEFTWKRPYPWKFSYRFPAWGRHENQHPKRIFAPSGGKK